MNQKNKRQSSNLRKKTKSKEQSSGYVNPNINELELLDEKTEKTKSVNKPKRLPPSIKL
ncbi:hypothetical protein [Paenibacillus albus]|uniref:hypothetical protein n=1 Tax=Paenibacillus albus TaxID=2495582 RepID=UPI0013E0A912|nr:hypothetical protein [Paenibacillus albus]